MSHSSIKYTHAIILLNEKAGSNFKDSAQVFEEALSKIGLKAELVVIAQSDNLLDICKKNVKRAKDESKIFVISGGDGSVNAAAKMCHEMDCPLGIVPIGTFNYFARNLKIPVSLEESLIVIRDGTVREVMIGKVNQHLFINNASFGLYTKLIEDREKHEAKFGRLRGIAFLSAVLSLFRHQRTFKVDLLSESKRTSTSTTMVFVGINALQLENLGLSVANCSSKDSLGVVTVKEMNRLETLSFLIKGILGRLKAEPNINQFCADSLVANLRRKFISIAIDGEIVRCEVPLTFSVLPRALKVLVPKSDEIA